MSGMKFRLQCSSCGTVFFATDRKARYCQKCMKKHSAKTAPAPAVSKPAAPAARPAHPARPARLIAKASRVVGTSVKTDKEPERKPAKAVESTSELVERVEKIYRAEFEGKDLPRSEMVKQISDRVWLKRTVVSSLIQKLEQPEIELTAEMKTRIIELYEGYVRRGERPENGRRKTISLTLNIPYHQVKDIVYRWSLSQYEMSPTHDLSRDQKFAMEKIYWNELKQERYRLNELPEKIAEQAGFATSYQVSRWLDMLYDDDRKFEHIEDLPDEIVQRIREGYLQYISASNPPELGLHTTLAQQIGGITPRQVHKVLQQFRKELRAAYPLQ
jgi:hypothetical protein